MRPVANQPQRSPFARLTARLNTKAIEMLGSEEKARKWLTTGQRALGGRVPYEVAKTPEGIAEVTDILSALEGG